MSCVFCEMVVAGGSCLLVRSSSRGGGGVSGEGGGAVFAVVGLARLKYLARPLILRRDPHRVTRDAGGRTKPTAAVITEGSKHVSGGSLAARGHGRGAAAVSQPTPGRRRRPTVTWCFHFPFRVEQKKDSDLCQCYAASE